MGKKQRRGIRFPRFSLEEANRIAKIVQDGGGELTLRTIADTLKLSSTSSGFQGRISSAKHFGLLTTKANIVKTTDLAKKILLPTSQVEVKQGLSEAFLTFSVFKLLCEKFQNSVLPERSILENILVRQYGISDASKKVAYDVFIESGKFADQLSETDQGIMCGIREIEKEDKLKITPITKVNEKMVELLKNIGSLIIAFRLHGKASEEVKKIIENMSTDLLKRTLVVAGDLDLPALKMSLKIITDRLILANFEGAENYIVYLEEGVREDLKLQTGE
ncbi:MAG: hypothetical protein ACETVR_00750 [Candidatus Bathyarchaeia archaeon]